MHVEWGLAGLREGGRQAEVVVVVDVLLFSTLVVMAAERGLDTWPVRAEDQYAGRIAERVGAALVVDPRDGLGAIASGQPLAVVSPTAALCLAAAASGATVVAAGLRNASAVGRWVGAGGPRRVVVAAAGERWRDGTPRVAVEDLLGAGAVLAATGFEVMSAEAQVAVAAFESSRPSLGEILRTCTSGRELAARGRGADVPRAAELDASDVVPVLRNGAFR